MSLRDGDNIVVETNCCDDDGNTILENIAVVEMDSKLEGRKGCGSVMTFHNITYTVKMIERCCRESKKKILSNVSGILNPGLNALMGSTGSGKSSLLDVLAKRKDPACIEGCVLLDGKALPKNFQYRSGYVIQNDLLIGTISVRETLWFCANLRLKSSISHAEKKEKIEKIIKDLSLTSCADTKIGNELIRGISGGEKKRTSIALELILEPQILFLDEPTTGLDSATAWSVMVLLKELGNQGHTIVCSIHQPRYSIYKLFDTLTLLSGGDLVYHGPNQQALPFFESLGYTCEMHDNPSDFFLDILNGNHKNDADLEKNIPEDKEDLTKTLTNAYMKSENCVALQSKLKKIEASAGYVKIESGRMYATSFWSQTGVLLKRTAKNMIRNPQALIGNLLINSIIGIAFGLMYFKVDDTEKGVQNRLGVLFFICTNLLFSATLVVENFVKEQDIFVHEHVSGYYSVLSYFISKVLADLIPLRTISPIVFCTITYWMVGFKADPATFFTFLLTAVLVSYSSVGVGLFYSASFRPEVGRLILLLTFIFTIIFSGLLVNVDTIMPWLAWIQYLSIARYGLAALSINELSGRIFQFCNNVTLPIPSPTALIPSNSTMTFGQTDFLRCFSQSGEEILHERLAIGESPNDIDAWTMWQNHVALGCIIVGLYTLTYIQLTRIKTYS